jgi:hypothetical protein
VATEKPQASVAPARAPDTTVARRKSRGWIYAGLTICILAAAVVLALRVARVKAAISAFKDPQSATQPNAAKGSTTIAPPSASADGNTLPASNPANGSSTATGVLVTSQPSATAGSTGPGGSGPGNTQPVSGAGTPVTGDVNAGQSSSSSVSSTNDNAKPKPVTQTTVADPATKNSSDPKNAADTASDTGTGDTVKAPRRPRTLNQDAATPGAASGVSVEGFHRSDVPDLLKSADGAAARGDYASARYGYGIVLRLEPRNPRARAGLQRVIQAERERQ